MGHSLSLILLLFTYKRRVDQKVCFAGRVKGAVDDPVSAPALRFSWATAPAVAIAAAGRAAGVRADGGAIRTLRPRWRSWND